MGYLLVLISQISTRFTSFTISDAFLLVIIVFLAANVKGLPFAWHFRLFHTLFRTLILSRPQKSSKHHQPPTPFSRTAIFAPISQSSHSPLLEIDINLHKSNSTYFSDLDISRIELLTRLFAPVLKIGGKGGELDVLLGGTGAVFKRAVMPYERYEVESRVVSWDGKWIYVLSQFLKKGDRKGEGREVAQGGRKRGSGSVEEAGKNNGGDADGSSKVLLATAVSRYTFKRKRETVAPAQVLERVGLLPSEDDRNGEEDRRWIEEERLKYLKLASCMGAMDEISEVL